MTLPSLREAISRASESWRKCPDVVAGERPNSLAISVERRSNGRPGVSLGTESSWRICLRLRSHMSARKWSTNLSISGDLRVGSSALTDASSSGKYDELLVDIQIFPSSVICWTRFGQTLEKI